MPYGLRDRDRLGGWGKTKQRASILALWLCLARPPVTFISSYHLLVSFALNIGAGQIRPRRIRDEL